MSLNLVTLTGKIVGGTPATTVKLTPSSWVADPGDEQILPPAPVTVNLSATGTFSTSLLATDNTVTPSGWYWRVEISAVPGIAYAAWSFFLPFANGATQDLSSLVQIQPPSLLAGYMPLPAGTPTPGYVPVATGTGETSQWAPNGTGGSGYPALPAVSGTPTAGQVLTATSGTAADWQTPSGAAVASVFGRTGAVVATSGDYSVGQVTGAAPLASPALSGTPTAPTAAALTDNTQVATTAYADSAVAVEKSRAQAAEALALPEAGGTMTGWLAPKVVTLTDAASTAINAAAGNVFEWALGGNHTLAAPSNPVSGQVILVDIQQPASGGPFTPSFASGAGGFSFGTDGQPIWSTAASAVDEIAFRYSALKTAWLCQGWKLGF